MGDNSDMAEIGKYLRPADADAVERVCNFLDAAANGMFDRGGFKGKITSLAAAATSGMLRKGILPQLRAAAADQKGAK